MNCTCTRCKSYLEKVIKGRETCKDCGEGMKVWVNPYAALALVKNIKVCEQCAWVRKGHEQPNI